MLTPCVAIETPRPDLCDGTYDQFCNMTPQFGNITEVLEKHGQHELVRFMDRYWLANSSVPLRPWAHGQPLLLPFTHIPRI